MFQDVRIGKLHRRSNRHSMFYVPVLEVRTRQLLAMQSHRMLRIIGMATENHRRLRNGEDLDIQRGRTEDSSAPSKGGHMTCCDGGVCLFNLQRLPLYGGP